MILHRGNRRSTAHGATLIYVIVGMVALVALVSLGVDVGHVWLAKTQLQHAADAAARYGLQGLAIDWQTARKDAIAAAADNTVDGNSVKINPSDVDFGTWDANTHTFVVLSGAARSNANAIRVTINRTAGNGNAVPLFFGSIIGASSCDVHAVSIAAATGGYGVVGILGLSLSGNSTIGYWAPTGSTNSHGSIASDGNISLSGGASITGDARPGPGGAVTTTGGSSVSGSTAPLSRYLIFPPGSAGSYATTNDNSNALPYWDGESGDFSLKSGPLTLPGGHYYFHDFNTSGSAMLSFSGPATIYVTGSLTLSAQTVTYDSLPKNLQIVMVGSGNVSLSGGSALYASVYAPLSPVTISGSAGIYGDVVGLNITASGGGAIHYDTSLPGGWNVTLVQ